MTSIKSNLRADERVVYVATMHWFYYVAPVLIILFGLMMTPANHDPLGNALGTFLILAGVAALVMRWLEVKSTEIVITNRKAAFQKGIISKVSCDLLLDKCDTINIVEPFWGRIMGYGTLLVTTNGMNGHKFRYVRNPQAFMSAIHNQLKK